MDSLDKIERVKERIAAWQEAWGNAFHYIISGFNSENEATGETKELITEKEERDIVYYLASKGFFEITDEQKGALHIRVLPPPKPIIKLKTLEFIARDLKDYYTGTEIIALLKEAGVDQKLIAYPQSKWLVFYAVFRELAVSKDVEDKRILFKVLGDAIHPLNFRGNTEISEELQKKFNKYLEYDGLAVLYSDAEKKYGVCETKNLVEMTEDDILFAENKDAFIQEQEELEFLRRPENKEKISTLRKAYQVFMNIAEVFCANPSKPSHELNDVYVQTKKLVTDVVRDLHLYVSGVQRIHTLAHYCIPFNNLFTAEKEYTPDDLEIDLSGKKLSWDYIRPRMNATYGDIDELYRKVKGGDIFSKPDVQQTLNDVSLLLSKIKEENKKQAEIKQKTTIPQTPVQKIEITAIPELQVKHVGDKALAKDKKRAPPIELSLPEPIQWKKVMLKIKAGRQEVEVFYGNSHIITADYIQLRFFVGKKQQKPDRQWGFLCALSTLSATDIQQATAENMRSMITVNKILSINNVQQIKKLLVERLQEIFKTNDDPFQDRRDYYYPKFNILPEPALRREEIWPQGGRVNENRAYEDSEEEAL